MIRQRCPSDVADIRKLVVWTLGHVHRDEGGDSGAERKAMCGAECLSGRYESSKAFVSVCQCMCMHTRTRASGSTPAPLRPSGCQDKAATQKEISPEGAFCLPPVPVPACPACLLCLLCLASGSTSARVRAQAATHRSRLPLMHRLECPLGLGRAHPRTPHCRHTRTGGNVGLVPCHIQCRERARRTEFASRRHRIFPGALRTCAARRSAVYSVR